MTRLATALVLLAGGLTAITTGEHEPPTVAREPLLTSGRHRLEAGRASRSMRRLPLSQLEGLTFTGRKARSRRAGRGPARSHVLPTGTRQLRTHDWDAVAVCESSGDWGASTGNGYYGGLQFSASSWASFGGKLYADLASNATRQQQIAVAERVLSAQGVGAWPLCGRWL